MKNIIKKLFTKKKGRSIIKKNYNPLKVNYKIYKKGSELYMENETLNQIRRLSEKYNKKELIILEMIKICKEMEYSLKDVDNIIGEFYLLHK